MAHAHDYPGARRSTNIVGRLRPIRRHRDQADEPFGGVLPAFEFVDVRRPYKLTGMRSSRSFFRGNMWPFHMKPLNGGRFRLSLAFERPLHRRQISQRAFYTFSRSRNNGREAARHTC